jgi:hypothetical protein
LSHDLWLGLGRCGPVAAWGGQRAAAETLDREDESIVESLAAVNSLLLLFFSSFFQSICPRTPQSDLAEQSAKNNLPSSPCQFAHQNQPI